MPAVPAIIMGGAALGSAWMGKKASDKATDAQNSALDLQRQTAQKQGQLSNSLMGYADKTYNLAQPALNKAMGYYSTLAGGNRAAINQTLAPQLAQLSDSYKGSANAIHNQLRGGARDYALAELNRGQAGQAGMMPMQARTGAMASLAGMGMGLAQQGQGWASNATSALNGAAGTAGQMGTLATGMERDQYSRANDLGKSISSIFAPYIWNLGKKGGGSVPIMDGPGTGGFGGGDY